MKRYFKTIFVTAVPFVITLGFAYLIGSFLSVSWNAAEWTGDMRIIMAEFGMCFGLALYMKLYKEMLV